MTTLRYNPDSRRIEWDEGLSIKQLHEAFCRKYAVLYDALAEAEKALRRDAEWYRDERTMDDADRAAEALRAGREQ